MRDLSRACRMRARFVQCPAKRRRIVYILQAQPKFEVKIAYLGIFSCLLVRKMRCTRRKYLSRQFFHSNLHGGECVVRVSRVIFTTMMIFVRLIVWYILMALLIEFFAAIIQLV